LSTLHREYAALIALPYYDLYEKVLRPQLSPIPAITPNDINQTMSNCNVNKPQAVAILGSLQADGFALIQGYVASVICWFLRLGIG
jgi:senataxin